MAGFGSSDEVALVDASQMLSWGDVTERVSRMANAMLEFDFPERSRLAVLGDNRADTLLTYAAAALAGVGTILVNHHLTADEVEYVLRDGAARAIWTSPATFDVATTAAGRGGIPVLASEGASNAWASLLEHADGSILPPNDLPAQTDLIYTSGTTGHPKGVEVPHWPAPTVAARLEQYARHYCAGLGPHLVVGPLYHSGPHGAVGLLLTGSPVVIVGRFDAERVLDAIETYRIATSVMVPTHFVRMLALPDARRQQVDVSSLRAIGHTGSRCGSALKKAMIEWFGPVLREAYGGTESGTICSISSEEWLTHEGSVGRVQPPFRPLVVAEDGSACPPGVQGELFFVDETGRGIRYHNDPAKTAAAHRAPGTFTLGDVGHLDEDGYLYVDGRVTDMVVSGGVNVYPAECERVLAEHPAVAEIAIFGVPDDEMGERVVGLVSLRDGAPPIEDILAFCRQSVAGYKLPKTLLCVNEIPRSAMGKVDKRAARQVYLDAQDSRGSDLPTG
jgi:long-chain acyl-CoA synthetase